MKLCAAQRLNASRQQAAFEEDAAFDGSRLNELKEIARTLSQNGAHFRASDSRLVMQCAHSMVVDTVRQCADCLNQAGWDLQIDYPGIFNRQTFGLKGRNGLVLQKVNTAISIFFTK